MDLLVRKDKALPLATYNPRQLIVLLDTTRWKIATLLSMEPSHAVSIAKALKMNEQLVYYHLRKLQKARIINVVRTEKRRGATLRYYSLTAPAFATIVRENWRCFASDKQAPPLLADFIENSRPNCKIIVGSPDYHGPEKQRARDLFYGIDLALLLGSYCTDVAPITLLDTEARFDNLKENVICIGGPISNLATKKFAPYMPITFKGRRIYSSLSGKEYTEATNGLIVKIENPLNKGKKVLILAGKSQQGTRAAVLTLLIYPNADYRNTRKKKIIAKVVEGVDVNGDGIVDDVDILE